MWADFNHGSVHSDDAYIQTIGSAGSRELIVQYNDVVFYDYDNAGATVTLQVVLFEGSNDIEFRYQDVVAGGAYQNGRGFDDWNQRRSRRLSAAFVQLGVDRQWIEHPHHSARQRHNG